MDFIGSVRDLETGFMSPGKFRRTVQHNLAKSICVESPRQFDMPSCLTYDFDLCNNRLVSVNGRSACIYDVSRSDIASYKIIGTRASEHVSRFGRSCVNWNGACSFFTISDGSPSIEIVDTERLITTTSFQFQDYVYQHKPNPINNNIIAVASNLKNITLIDRRSRDITYFRSSGMPLLSVAWSPLDESVLVAAGESEILFTDLRMLQKRDSYKTKEYYSRLLKPTHLPEVQFVPNSNIVIANLQEKIYRFNLYNNESKAFKMTVIESDSMTYAIVGSRLKYSLVGEPPIMFYPWRLDVRIIDLNKKKIISTLMGYTEPAKLTLYNSIKNELYSSGRDDHIIWVAHNEYKK